MNEKESRDFVRQKNAERFSPNKNFQLSYNEDLKTESVMAVTNAEDINGIIQGYNKIIPLLNKSAELMKENKKAFSDINETVMLIKASLKEWEDGIDNSDKNAKILESTFKRINKVSNVLSKEAVEGANNIFKEYQSTFDTALNYMSLMKRESRSYAEDLKTNIGKVKTELREMAKDFNLQKLVTGGLSIKDLRQMQAGVKVNLNLDDTGFMGVQRSLIEQNKQILEQSGQSYLTFSDAISYMQSVSNYTFKNYNQMTAMYKQVSIGTKYLGITSQSMNSLVKATNALANDSFMTRQVGLIAALSTDDKLVEDTTSLAQFVGRNATSVNARYNNANNILTDSVAINSVVSSILGNESQSVINLMEELMGSTDFSQLSQGNQMWLNWAGLSSQVQQQMRSGNLNMQQIVLGALRGIQNMSRDQQTALQTSFGLKDIVTLGGSYGNNASEYQRLLSNQLRVMNGMSPEEALEAAGAKFETRTDTEKIMDDVSSLLGLQDRNWRKLFTYVQLITAAVSVFKLTGSFIDIKRLLVKGTKDGILSPGASALLSSGKLAGLAKFALPAAGIGLGINDAIQMQGSTGKGWLADSARGLFLGTGSAQKSTGENALSVLGNAGKGALIGSLLGPVGALVGGGIGAILGLIGTSRDNQKALEDNTKATKKNNSVLGDVATESYLERLYQNSSSAGGIGATGAYPWSVSSNFGTRSVIQTKNGATSKFHTGIDLINKEGTPIGANWAGIVKGVGTDSYGANYVILGHNNGFDTAYWHLKSRSHLRVGQTVNAGDLIGYMGQTGLATGPHLHFEVRKQGAKGDARYINPANYVTNGIFSANGDQYTAITDGSVLTSNDAEVQYIYRNNTSAGATGEVSMGGNYATSNDIDRLIETIVNLKQSQNEQKELMQMLAGKNTFRYGRE